MRLPGDLADDVGECPASHIGGVLDPTCDPPNVAVSGIGVVVDGPDIEEFGPTLPHDTVAVEHVDPAHRRVRAGEPDLVGGGGVESFRFQSLAKGKTFILFKSRRPWEPIVGEQQVFEINIK